MKSQANDAVERSRALVAIREAYLSEAIQTRSSLPALVELITRTPVVTVKSVQTATGLTNQGSRTLIRAAESRGWLQSIGARGRGGREFWVAPRVLDVMEAPRSYTQTGGDNSDPTQASLGAGPAQPRDDSL